MLKGIPNVSGNVYCLNLKSAKIVHFPVGIIGDEYYIDVPSTFTGGVVESDFGQRTPSRTFFKEEGRSMIGYNPILTESYRTSYDRTILMIDAAYSKGVLCFVLGTIWNLVVEGAEAEGAISICFGCSIIYQISEYLREGL
jgi:hypothetical protein